MSWTNERIELLQKLWLQGWSASRIAGELACGITRNAVIGKVYRLGLFSPAPNSPPPPRPPARGQSANRREYRPRFSPVCD
jgi:GcrA cell cycle regulator